jgi:hypothetical protein
MSESAVAVLCENLRDLRQVAGEYGHSAAVEGLVIAARVGDDIEVALREVFRRLGLPGTITRDLSAALPGLGTGRPLGEVYGCPAALCPRAWVRAPGTAVPVCSLHEKPLSLIQG